MIVTLDKADELVY